MAVETTSRSVAVLVGSLRKGSFSRMLAHALSSIAPPSMRLEIVEIGAMPFYDQDLDGPQTPDSWQTFRGQIKAADAVLFVTPEYNRSVPGVLKNAVDVASRPYGEGAWNGKPGAVISLSPGALGGFGANHHLRQTMMAVNIPTLQAPEAYIGGVAGLFDESGVLVKEDSKAFLLKFLSAFATFIEANRKPG